jgi:hypothetical protein
MYLKQAKTGFTDWWRYVLILLIAFMLNILAGLPIGIFSAIKALSGNVDINEFKTTFNPEALGLSQNAGLLLMIAPLSLVFIGLAFAIKALFRYSWAQVFTSYSRFRWKNFLFSAFLWLILLGVADAVYYQMHPETYSFHFNQNEFIGLLVICLVFIPFQTSWEELYFRGNLMQGFGLLTRSRWVALLFTSLLFGSVHYFNPEVKEYGTAIAMTQYIGFGLLLGITVIMDGGLEMAFGMHAINNIYAGAIVSYSGSVLNTPALISSEQNDTTYMTFAFFIAAIIFLIIAKFALKWKSFRWLAEPLRD